MIKKVMITDIHPKDMYYKSRHKLIGSIITIEIDEENQLLKGWTTTKGNKDLMLMDKNNLSGHEFYGIQFEEVA